MRIFLSAGEPSGDLHGGNLVRSLADMKSDLQCLGFGGERMAAAGCRLLYPLSNLAVMGLAPVFAHATVFLDLLSRTDRLFRHDRPDGVVLIDFPGFNWWVARRAHFHRIPVFYFVPPQLWAWAGWRVQKMRRWVDLALCSLPFEEAWYRERGVSARYVGHPFFDELPNQKLDPAFLASQQSSGQQIIALLPGSRTSEVRRNLSTLIRTAAHVHAQSPNARFLFACFKQIHKEYVAERLRGRNLPIEVHAGRTAEIIDLAHSCVAVSGSVSLELLYRQKPTVVLYRVHGTEKRLAGWFQKCPYISLVNLLAGKEIFPEFLSVACPAEAIGQVILGWLQSDAAYSDCRAELAALKTRVAQPGACSKAASAILEAIDRKSSTPQPDAA
jgi:lipid-A-disaccharide synthase